MKLIERENEILNILKNLSESGIDFVVVGGYAVSALARHRFSVDCDVVIPKEEIKSIENLLTGAGYRKRMEKSGFDTIYGGFFANYEKNVNDLPITVDLLIGSLVNKSTNASWSFEYIKQNSITAAISGIKFSVTCKVPKKDLLIAMKIHSARKTDIRDIIVLNEKVDWSTVLKHAKRGDLKKFKTHLDEIILSLHDERLIDSLKGVFNLKKYVKDMIFKAVKEIEILMKKIS